MPSAAFAPLCRAGAPRVGTCAIFLLALACSQGQVAGGAAGNANGAGGEANTTNPTGGDGQQGAGGGQGATGGDGNAALGGGNGVPATDANQTTNPNAVSPNVVQQPNGAAVQFLGRFDTETDPNVYTMAWPGSQVLVGFEGTRLVVRLGAPDAKTYDGVAQSPYVAASVDGGNETLYKLTRGTFDYALAQNLPAGQHTARILLRTEAQIGRVSFVSATTDGKLSYTPAASGRRIEFVGDSGAAGYGADGTYPCSFSATTENAGVSYPIVVGQLLNAEVRNLSYSGKGLVQNRDMVDDAYKTLPVLWQRTLPYDDPYVLWDANAWRPQVVVLITGGNDFYVAVPDQATYVSKVSDFVTTLKAAYPGVKVFLGASPMLRNDSHPTQRETAIAYLKLVASQAGDPNVQYLDIPGPDLNDPNTTLGANGFGCDQHPTATTHRKVAQSVAATLKAQLGW